jgi:hypothetical protein
MRLVCLDRRCGGGRAALRGDCRRPGRRGLLPGAGSVVGGYCPGTAFTAVAISGDALFGDDFLGGLLACAAAQQAADPRWLPAGSKTVRPGIDPVASEG